MSIFNSNMNIVTILSQLFNYFLFNQLFHYLYTYYSLHFFIIFLVESSKNTQN